MLIIRELGARRPICPHFIARRPPAVGSYGKRLLFNSSNFNCLLMISLFRLLIKLAACAAVVAFAAAIGMAWLFAHPEVNAGTVKRWVHQASQ